MSIAKIIFNPVYTSLIQVVGKDFKVEVVYTTKDYRAIIRNIGIFKKIYFANNYDRLVEVTSTPIRCFERNS